jgi:REP element-mobilizing transposase RayT
VIKEVMPRQSRIDASGALHHVIGRGIGQRTIFDDDQDRSDFINRLSNILKETKTLCYAWALIPNHFHLLLRTGNVPIATVMRRLLTGYAITYNLRHHRWGHLFQNRYKSILCQEEPYLLELVRYIHLNPLRANIVNDMEQLDNYTFSGHSIIMGKKRNDWQDIEAVLARFAGKGWARRKYHEFIFQGIEHGKRTDLTGGGLILSVGGWSALEDLRKAKGYVKGDERILGDSDFVDQVLRNAEDAFNRRYELKAKGMNLEKVAERVGRLFDMKAGEVWSSGKNRKIVHGRSLLCYWAVKELGETMTSMARRLNISVTAVGKSVARGEALAKKNGYLLFE